MIARSPIVPGAVIRVRPVGVLLMEDDKGGDEKLITVLLIRHSLIIRRLAGMMTCRRKSVTQQIEHFFQHYKDLEPGKWAETQGAGAMPKLPSHHPRMYRARKEGRQMTDLFRPDLRARPVPGTAAGAGVMLQRVSVRVARWSIHRH